MKEEKRLFPAQEKSELVLDIIRKHWFSYVIFWLLAFVMLIPLFVGTFYWFSNNITISPNLEGAIIVFVPMYLLVIQGLLIFGFVDFYLDIYIITDRRIVDIAQNGLFKRTISELNLAQIQDVNATVEGFAATLLHFGDVQIQSAAERPNFIFRSIPHPYEISKKILDLHEAYLQQQEKMGENRQTKQLEEVIKLEQVDKKDNLEKNDSNKNEDSISESLNKTLTEKWFDEKSESYYSDTSSRQRLLDGVNRHIKENMLAIESGPISKEKEPEKKEQLSKTESGDKEGELKEGKKIDL